MDRRIGFGFLAGMITLFMVAPLAEAQVKARAPGGNRGGGSLLSRSAPRSSSGVTAQARRSVRSTRHTGGIDRAHGVSAYHGYGKSPYGYGGYPYGLYNVGYNSGYSYYDRDWYRSPIVSYGQPYPVIITTTGEAKVQAEPPARELSDAEKAELALRSGEPREAVRLLEAALDEAGASEATDGDTGSGGEASPELMRLLALSLFDAGRVEESAAMIGLAYGREPSLAGNPVRRGVFGDGSRELRRRVNGAVQHANKADTPSSWLLVCVLMQAEGRDQVASKMAERAMEAGLDEGLGAELLAAMRG